MALRNLIVYFLLETSKIFACNESHNPWDPRTVYTTLLTLQRVFNLTIIVKKRFSGAFCKLVLRFLLQDKTYACRICVGILE